MFHAVNLAPRVSAAVGGDFNCLLDIIDVENGLGFRQKSCPTLKNVVITCNLIDAFRFLYPYQQDFTFHRQGSSSSRLDRFYITADLVEDLVSTAYLPSLSDHNCVKMLLNVQVDIPPSSTRNIRGYWKLNTAILNKDFFLDCFKPFWATLVSTQNSYQDVSEWWDCWAKPEIKRFCIGYSINRRATRDQNMHFLLACLKLAYAAKD